MAMTNGACDNDNTAQNKYNESVSRSAGTSKVAKMKKSCKIS